jgi:hypothetical protein
MPVPTLCHVPYPLRFTTPFPAKCAKLQHEEAVGKETTFVRTALWLHACAFYSIVHSQPQPGVCVPTADYTAEEEGHVGTAARATCLHGGLRARAPFRARTHESMRPYELTYET